VSIVVVVVSGFFLGVLLSFERKMGLLKYWLYFLL